MENQPKWKLVAQLGDVNPIDYGGEFVFVDETGVYPPELERLIPITNRNEDIVKWYSYRCIMENLTADSVKKEWFYDRLYEVASCIGQGEVTIIEWLLSDEPSKRALAWIAIGDYFGNDNLNSYPEVYKSEDEIPDHLKQKL